MYHKNINISDNFNLIETFAFFVISSCSVSILGSIIELFEPLLVIQHINIFIFSF